MEPIFASSSGVEGQWMEALVVLVAWCWWLLLKISSSQTKNKLEVTGLALDPDMEAMAGSVCSSVAVAQDLRLVFVALHGDENGIGLLILVLLLADLHQGSIEAALGVPPRRSFIDNRPKWSSGNHSLLHHRGRFSPTSDCESTPTSSPRCQVVLSPAAWYLAAPRCNGTSA
jgi:hypothetical protein